jgi:hypothetical protein
MAWNPDSGKSPNRGFVLCDEIAWRHYHTRLREIMHEWPADADTLGSVALMREAERRQLRLEVAELVRQGFSGSFLVPI